MSYRRYLDSQGRVTDVPEWIRQRFGGTPSKRQADRQNRSEDIKALRQIKTPDAAQFRRENPDADIYDYQRKQKTGK